MTYICAGTGSPGRRGWVRVVAGVGRCTPPSPHPFWLLLASSAGSPSWPAPRLLGSFSYSPFAACRGGPDTRRAAGRSCSETRCAWSEKTHRLPGARVAAAPLGDPSPAQGGLGEPPRGVGISFGCSSPRLLIRPRPLSGEE